MALFDYLHGVALRDLDVTRELKDLPKAGLLAPGRYDFILAPSISWEAILTKFNDHTICIFERSGHSPPT